LNPFGLRSQRDFYCVDYIMHTNPAPSSLYNSVFQHFGVIQALMTDTVRIDKWLWAARFFRTRSLATNAVERGKIRLNGEPTKPSRNLKVNDTLAIDNGATVWEIVVLGLSGVRGAAPVAQALYAETEKSIAKRQQVAEQNRFFRDPGAGIKGRPTKRDRRLLDNADKAGNSDT
jgi:ribosome-associated heat shock protein Hsp15